MNTNTSLRIFWSVFLSLTLLQCNSTDYTAHQNSILKHRNQIFLTFSNPAHSPLEPLDFSTFKGLNYFEFNPSFAFPYTFSELSFMQKSNIKSSKGNHPVYFLVGEVAFNYNGDAFTLNAYTSEEKSRLLFIPFTDNTSGNTTYASGRYLELHLDSNKQLLDFNLAYNPYCAYNTSYDCPIPPSENHLPFAVEAGEKVFKKQNQEIKIKNDTSEIERACLAIGLVNMAQIDSSIRIDIKYSSTDNFLKQDVYETFNQAYLHPQTAEKLRQAQLKLKKRNPQYTLIVFDAARPVSVQTKMWNALDMPDAEKQKYVSDPKKGSLHNYGLAVDLSIFDLKTGRLLDMGTPYDFFGKLAYPKHEQELRAQGKLTAVQLQNRQLLRSLMIESGFTMIQTEWWHFNTFSKAYAAQHMPILK